MKQLTVEFNIVPTRRSNRPGDGGEKGSGPVPSVGYPAGRRFRTGANREQDAIFPVEAKRLMPKITQQRREARESTGPDHETRGRDYAMIFKPTPTEIEAILLQLEQAVYNHERWYESLVATLVCRLPYDRHDVDPEAHCKCRFGQWLYGTAPALLQSHPSWSAMEMEHRRMHELAARLLQAGAGATPVAVSDYEIFANALEALRLEIGTLERELKEMRSSLDPLTGAYSRTTLLTFLREQQVLVKRRVMSCALVMMDVDHFKNVNDTYGHQVGDRMLVAVARYTMEHLRPFDKVFRYGGEEFVIAMQNTDVDGAERVIQRMGEGLAQAPIYHEEQMISVTASFGIAPLDAASSVEEAVDRSDQAMYAAKTAGRNCTRVWQAAAQS